MEVVEGSLLEALESHVHVLPKLGFFYNPMGSSAIVRCLLRPNFLQPLFYLQLPVRPARTTVQYDPRTPS